MIYHNGFSQCLSAGMICLLVGGTLAAKTVFLVDNEIESQTEFSGAQWQLDRKSLQKYPGEIEKLTYQYLDRLTKLPDRKAWCGSAQEISLVLAKAKSLNSIELTNLIPGQADILVKLPPHQIASSVSSSSPTKNLHLYVNPEPQDRRSIPSWCISPGLGK